MPANSTTPKPTTPGAAPLFCCGDEWKDAVYKVSDEALRRSFFTPIYIFSLKTARTMIQ